MKEVKTLENIREIIPILFLIAIIPLVVKFLNANMLEIFILLNIGTTIIIFLFIYLSVKINDYSYYLKWFYYLIIFSIAVSICAIRHILLLGEKYDGIIIGFFANLIEKSGFEGILIWFISIYSISIFQMIVISGSVSEMTKSIEEVSFDSLKYMQFIANLDFLTDEINKEEIENRQMFINKEHAFYLSLRNIGIFLSGYEKVRNFIIFLSIIGALLLTYINNGVINIMEKPYSSLLLCYGLLSIIPSLLLYVSIKKMIMNILLKKEENNNSL